jgi:SAM-dependent methyltransferase
VPDQDVRAYWEQRLSRHRGLDGVGYLRLGEGYNRWLYRLRRVVFLQRMRATGVDFSAAEVLDVGSGTGFYVERWLELGAPKVVGIDLTTVATEELWRRFPGQEFHTADVGGDLGVLAGRGFDAVSCLDVLFHVLDDDRFEAAIRNLAGLVRPGGLLVLSDNFLHPGAMERSVPAPHVANRSLAQFEDVLGRNRFEIIERVPMFFVMNAPADSTSRLARARWLAVAGPVSMANGIGWLAGAALYPLERLLVSTRGESPSTELMICRRNGSSAT